MLAVPYYLNIKLLAEYTSIYQIILLYLVLFEFGLSISYVRFKKLYSVTKYINSITQLFIFLILILFSLTSLGNLLNNSMNLNSIGIKNEIIFYSVLFTLSWGLLKSMLLSNKRFYIILFLSFSILILRIIFLITLDSNNINSNELFKLFFIYPFIHILLMLLLINFNNIIELIKFKFNYKNKFSLLNFSYRIKKYFQFSFFQYINAILYAYTLKILIIFLLEKEQINNLAEIGYAMTFIGIVSIFVMSIRNYYISKFSFSDKEQINNFLINIKKLKLKLIFFSIIILISLSILIFLIKPNYLSNNTILYTNIIIASYIIISYLSMSTLLTKTFNENKLEFYINLFRTVGVYLITYFTLELSFLLTLCLIYTFIPSVEYMFSKILIKKIRNKGILIC